VAVQISACLSYRTLVVSRDFSKIPDYPCARSVAVPDGVALSSAGSKDLLPASPGHLMEGEEALKMGHGAMQP
jgi:hypothetical protein